MVDDYYHTLARQFAAMWQDGARAAMQDERFFAALLEVLSSITQPGAKPHAKPKQAARDAAVSPDACDAELARLARRVERLEKRLAKVEAGKKKRTVAKRR